MSRTITDTITYTTTSCCVCGVLFALTSEYENARRRDHKDFYCPNGHPLAFNGPSEAEKRAQRAEEEAERFRRERDAETVRAEFWAKEHKATKQELTTTKGQLTKTKKRLAGGVCPCCNRSFVSLAKHMASQHPDYQES